MHCIAVYLVKIIYSTLWQGREKPTNLNILIFRKIAATFLHFSNTM